MNAPQEQVSGKTILDDAAIIRLKQYIERKHPEFNSVQRAAVLANAVHRIVDRHLPDFEEGTKVRLRRELLRRAGLEQRFALWTGHILEACLELELEETGMRQLAAWMEQHQLAAPWSFPSVSEQGAVNKVEPAPHSSSVRGWIRHILQMTAIVLVLLMLAADMPFSLTEGASIAVRNGAEAGVGATHIEASPAPEADLPGEYSYRQVNGEKLRDWLQARDSMLADEPYFSAILTAAEEHNIHPLLMFAITGQEQAYVPKGGKRSNQIANNPFNVYHSWETYNTDIVESARVAAQTILNISKSRPDGVHPIQWLNTRYAEDPNWWVGVTSIFKKLKKETQDQAE